MIRTGPESTSWLVPLADLSLILFILAGGVAASTSGQDAPAARERDGLDAPAVGVASSIYYHGEGAAPLSEMLAMHQPSLGEQLTIMGHFVPGERDTVTQQVEALAQEAVAHGQEPRIILQPASATQVIAYFAQDSDPQLAHSLLSSGS